MLQQKPSRNAAETLPWQGRQAATWAPDASANLAVVGLSTGESRSQLSLPGLACLQRDENSACLQSRSRIRLLAMAGDHRRLERHQLLQRRTTPRQPGTWTRLLQWATEA